MTPAAARDGDRGAALAAEIEALLLEGLDRYFARQYDEAIHVWTRVLFLDRTHPRARAYIDRARTALAERQRRGDELLQASQDLLDRGAVEDARAMLRSAVDQGADDARSAALWLKVERRQRARATASISAEPSRVPLAPSRRWGAARIGALALVLSGAAVVVALAVKVGRDWLAVAPSDVLASQTVAPPVVLSSADVALVRARTLYAHGRLAEALTALDRVRPTDSQHAEADSLRREIQRLLLATAQSEPRPPQGSSP